MMTFEEFRDVLTRADEKTLFLVEFCLRYPEQFMRIEKSMPDTDKNNKDLLIKKILEEAAEAPKLWASYMAQG